MARARDRRLVRWRVLEQRQRVLPCVASHLAHLVEDLTLLVLAHVPIPRRQRAYQLVPTGSLYCLTDLTFGRILISGKRAVLVGKFLRQRAEPRHATAGEQMCVV